MTKRIFFTKTVLTLFLILSGFLYPFQAQSSILEYPKNLENSKGLGGIRARLLKANQKKIEISGKLSSTQEPLNGLKNLLLNQAPDDYGSIMDIIDMYASSDIRPPLLDAKFTIYCSKYPMTSQILQKKTEIIHYYTSLITIKIKKKNLLNEYIASSERKYIEYPVKIICTGLGAGIGFAIGKTLTPWGIKKVRQWASFKKLSDSKKQRITTTLLPLLFTGIPTVIGGTLTFITAHYAIPKTREYYFLS